VKISTLYFGEQEFSDDTVLHFPAGLPGFEQCVHYKLFHEEGKPTVYWMQALDDPTVMFSVTEPLRIGLAYELMLSDAESEALQIEDSADVTMLVILSRPEPDGPVQVHQNSPLVVNLEQRVGLQKSLPRLQEITLLRAVE